jgi:hypothetical protein
VISLQNYTNTKLGNVIAVNPSIKTVPETGIISSFYQLATDKRFGFVSGGGNITISDCGVLNTRIATSTIK